MWFIGDTHGNHSHIRGGINRNGLENQHLIHVGDFGVGFTTFGKDMVELILLNRFLREGNNVLHVFRGNHDDPEFFNGDYHFSNLILHEDYTILDIENKKLLGVGGGISIDREYRKKHKHGYWEDETVVFNEEKLNDITEVDILVTHTAMDFCTPQNNGVSWPPIVSQFFPNDPDLAGDLMKERNILTNIYNKLVENGCNITNHFYGHFHRFVEEEIYGVKHTLLDIGQFYELKDYTDYENELTKKYE